MSYHCYYQVDSTGPIYEFTDNYHYDIEEDVERESLFTMIANIHYGDNGRMWNLNPSHQIVICEKDGTPIRSMQVDMYLEPTFEAYDR